MTLPTDFRFWLSSFNEWVLIGPMESAFDQFDTPLPLICVDGGANKIPSMDLWIGDADSLVKKVEDLCFRGQKNLITLPAEKDLSDLAFTFDFLKKIKRLEQQKKSLKHLHLWGFLGGRKDHELFNIGETLSFLEGLERTLCSVYFDRENPAYHFLGPGKWKLQINGTFSLGSLVESSIEMTGQLKYPVHSSQIMGPFSSFGLSNQGWGEILLKNDRPIFIYYPFPHTSQVDPQLHSQVETQVDPVGIREKSVTQNSLLHSTKEERKNK